MISYPDFGLVWDVHDGVKHFKLDRNGREVTSATQTGIGRMGMVKVNSAKANTAAPSRSSSS